MALSSLFKIISAVESRCSQAISTSTFQNYTCTEEHHPCRDDKCKKKHAPCVQISKLSPTDEVLCDEEIDKKDYRSIKPMIPENDPDLNICDKVEKLTKEVRSQTPMTCCIKQKK